MLLPKWTVFFSLLTLTSALSAQSDTPPTDLEIIYANIKQFSADLIAGDWEALTAAYTDDAKIFPGGHDILRGAEAIKTYWTPDPDEKGRNIQHQIMPEEITFVGTTAYDWGYYEGVWQDGEGEEHPYLGKYVIVWHKQEDGNWKIYLDIWNRVPMAED